MYARALDDATERLHELRDAEHGQLLLGTLALVLAVGSTEVVPSVAMPLFLGGVVVLSMGVISTWHRWELIDRLVGDRDAYVIPEVRERAAREATLERRRVFAALLRTWVRSSATADSRFDSVRAEAEALVAELEDETLALDDASAVACMRLLSEPGGPSLWNDAARPEDVLVRVRQIRAGFGPGEPSAA